MLKINVDNKAVVAALEKAGHPVSQEFTNGLEMACEVIAREARVVHRYISRSNILDRSIKFEAERNVGTVYLDWGIAAYGSFQHDGTITYRKGPKWPGNRGIKKTGGIRPDPFIFNAAANKLQDVFRIIAKSLAIGLSKAGLI